MAFKKAKHTPADLADAAMAKMILEVGNSFKATRKFSDNRFGTTNEVAKNTNQLAKDVKDRLSIIAAIRGKMENPDSGIDSETVQDILDS